MSYIPDLATLPADARVRVGAAEPCISGPFPARVKGLDARGERFKFSTALECLSAAYCEVRLEGVPEPGRYISVAARVHYAVIILRGVILGVLPRASGARYVAVSITRYRFVTTRQRTNPTSNHLYPEKEPPR